ncbi:hypothetical protein QAD02_022372 [Eretmocerus hayati]|uniref:Uncharacterized protein n=1 Tax=Eretmocerus hayati TaxID=131215 RepID=A0ACC2PUE4_9HYME|nr:hypothetical protein QAD02_022372 [Eretmocerus hayati]
MPRKLRVVAVSSATFLFLWLIAGEVGSLGYQESTSYNFSRKFQIIWNVPTFMCHKYGLDFSQVSTKFGFSQNEGDEFRGDKIALLYDPGYFPAMLKDDEGNYAHRNGGVPQEGNLTLHLEYLSRNITEQIPDEDFSGLAVIDFESWRPVFRQNWASLQVYREFSFEIERKRHPFWSERSIQKEASDRFEHFGQIFMERSIELAQNLRPYATWAYYAYPYCFNWTPNQNTPQCSSKAINENDQMSWLFGNAKLMLPSVYLQQRLERKQRITLVRNRVGEAMRLAKKSQLREEVNVYAYYWYKYQDDRDSFVDKHDLTSTISEIAKRGANGVIIWGSSNDVDSESKCYSFHEYFMQTLGPTLKRLQREFSMPTSTFNQYHFTE